MKRAKIVSPILVALCFICMSHNVVSDSGDQPQLENSMPSSSILFKSKGKNGEAINFDIREDIKRGQEFLKDKMAGYSIVKEEKKVSHFDRKGRRREKLVRERIIKPNFLLAVEDLRDRKIWQVRITDKGCVTDGFVVTKSRNNGVGSTFEVNYPEHMAVLALRTMVRSNRNSFKEVVYTAYSPEIDTWQVRKDGLDYLAQQIELARKNLEARKVTLIGLEGQGNDIMLTEIALVLSIIEHIDPLRFKNCPEEDKIALVHEVLTIIGANTTHAYAYSRSPAGAMGLFQLVPDTYKRLRGKYPRAGLDKDFVAGCTDHLNAAKASLLLFDSDLADLPKERLSAIRRDARAAGKYLAAAYNCGSGRVGKSARRCGREWACHLPEETKIYLKKFDVVWDLRETLDR
ncbi:MAG TPA: transglycosylase SLT domain-containing protein [Syntrophorhabdales bacterium]|nr:transglycosylase SLT domain-containing protein [Syntrophorhabdales bacterium]